MSSRSKRSGRKDEKKIGMLGTDINILKDRTGSIRRPGLHGVAFRILFKGIGMMGGRGVKCVGIRKKASGERVGSEG